MRKACIVLIGVLMVSGAAWATDYQWTSAATGNDNGYGWVDNANWAPTGIPMSAADTAHIGNGGKLDLSAGFPIISGGERGGTITVGSVLIDNNSSLDARYTIVTFNVVDDCGETGDFIYKQPSSYQSGYHTHLTMNIDGRFVLPSIAFWGNYDPDHDDIVNLYGTGKEFVDKSQDGYKQADLNIYGSYYDNGSQTNWAGVGSRVVTVKSGGQIIANPGGASRWDGGTFVFEDGQANLPALGSNVDFYYHPLKADNQPVVGVHDYGFNTSVVYPRHLYVGADYWGGTVNGAIFYKPVGGDIRTKGDFTFNCVRSYALTANGHWLHLIDNITGAQRNMYVDGLFRVGGNTSSGLYGVKFYNADVKIGGNLRLGGGNPQGASLKLDNATIRVGGSIEWYQTYIPNLDWNRDNWDPGTSTIIMDGNDITPTSGTRNVYIETYGAWYPLHTLIADYDEPGGRVNLDYNAGPGGDLNLTGDLKVLSGQFRSYGHTITFQGTSPQTLFVDNDATIYNGRLDNVITAANAVVNLASDISLTGLHMLSGSEIYLNGFTLSTTNYGDFDGTLEQNWTIEGGTIFGASPANIPGDANGDGKVDGGDLSIWQSNYDPVGTGNNTFAMGDFDGNGKIDGGDLSIWQANYDPVGAPGVDGMGTQVPEPATMLLLGTGLLGGLGVIRRRRSK